MSAKAGVDVEINSEGSEGIKDVKELNQELNKTGKAQEQVAKKGGMAIGILKRFLVVAAAIAAVDLGRRMISFVKGIDDVTQSLEISAESAQAYAIASRRAGIELHEVEGIIKNLAREQGKENNLFHTLGVSLDDMRTKHPAAMFDMIARNIADGSYNALQMRTAINLMGADGVRTLKALMNGFADFKDEALSSKQVVSDEVMEPAGEAIADVNTGLENLALSFKSLLIPAAETFGKIVLPIMNGVADTMSWIESRLPSLLSRVKALVIGTLFTGSSGSGNLTRGLKAMKKQVPAIKKADAGSNARLRSSLAKRQELLSRRRASGGGATDVDAENILGRGERVAQLASVIGGSARGGVGDLSSAGIFATSGSTAAANQQRRSIQLLQRISINTARTNQAISKQ